MSIIMNLPKIAFEIDQTIHEVNKVWPTRPVASYEATEVRTTVKFSCSNIKFVLWITNLLFNSSYECLHDMYKDNLQEF